MFKKKAHFIISISLPVLIFCSSPENTFTIEEIDGVKFIHNHSPLWGNQNKIFLELIRSIGGLEGTDENYILFQPKDVALDNAGNIFVLDAGNYRVQKYDPEGKFLTSFGKAGQGPGELEMPEYMQSDDEGNIYVFDRGNNKFIVYDNDGENINNIALVSESDFQIMNSGNFAAFPRTFYSGPEGDQSENQALIKVYNRVMELENDFGIKRQYENSNLRSSGNFFNYTIDKNDNIYLAFHYQNRIEKYNAEGNRIFRVDRKLNYEESESIEPVTVHNARYGMVSIFSRGIEVDHMGRIWVINQTRQFTLEEKVNRWQADDVMYHFEIYDPDGILLTTMELETLTVSKYFRDRGGFRIFGDRLFIVDALNNMIVYEYKIVEN